MNSVIDEKYIATLIEVPELTSPVDERKMSTIIEMASLLPQVAGFPKKKSASQTFEGRIVSMTGDKLVMSSKAGTEYRHTLAEDAKLTCDGAVCQPDALKPGRQIRVTTQQGDRHVLSGIESLNKNAAFADCGPTRS